MLRKSSPNRSRKPPGTSRSSLWPSSGSFEASWGSFGTFWGSVGTSWGSCWASWGAPGRSWGALGSLWGASGTLQDPPKSLPEALPPRTGARFWLHFGGHVGSILGPPGPQKTWFSCGGCVIFWESRLCWGYAQFLGRGAGGWLCHPALRRSVSVHMHSLKSVGTV